jgi:hypothetical protein
MTKNEIIEIANTLIGYGKVREALEALSAYVKGLDRYTENDLLMQTANFNRNHRDYHNGMITKDNYEIVMARLNYALTQIIERLPEQGNEVEADLTPPPDPDRNANNDKNERTPTAEIRKILFLSANPKDQVNLRLGEELRKVKDGLEASTQRDKFDLVSEPAVRIATITKAMQKHKPEIVHFSGHGEGITGLVVENDAGQTVLFPNIGLDRLFKLFKKQVKCVVLNACYSKEQAGIISKHGIYVVGMNKDIADKAAIDFSVGFYQSIGEGNDYEFAYEIAMVNVSSNLRDADAPELWKDGEKISE